MKKNKRICSKNKIALEKAKVHKSRMLFSNHVKASYIVENSKRIKKTELLQKKLKFKKVERFHICKLESRKEVL